MDPPLTQIGRFNVERELGRGGMGVVYLAWDADLERRVAIKLFGAAGGTPSDRLERLMREARLLAALNHPNVATVYSLEKAEDDARLIVMEHVEGDSLAFTLARGALNPSEALRACGQIACAIEAAHHAGVIHRDLKPSNVMLTEGGLVKVLDFGIARRSGMSGSGDAGAWDESMSELDTSLTRPGAASGTPGYMSPEQIRGEEHDRRTDIFAFGCLVYECLTGAPVFGGTNTQERLMATLDHEPDWEGLPEGVPDTIQTMLRRSLEKDPGKRLSDIGGFRVALMASTRRAEAGPPRVERVGPDFVDLPAPLTRFIGRAREMKDLDELLDAHRLVTLTGSGGCGKTRLAIELARQEASGDGRICFVELGAIREGSLVERAVFAALGGDASDGLINAVSGGSVFVVLDNCEHVLPACREIAGSLLAASDGVRVLATSQTPLGVMGEQTFRVPSLSVPPETSGGNLDEIESSESVRLFVDRARLVRPGFRLDADSGPIVARICRRLDGIPLAIELAASRTAALRVEDIDNRLSDRFSLLKSTAGDRVPRHQTLLASIEWSYEHLSEPERQLLARLSVFSGGWTLEAAEIICSDEPSSSREVVIEFHDVLDLLMRLVDKSLIVLGEDSAQSRYRLLQSVREFATEKLEGEVASAVKALRRRHTSYYASFAQRIGAEATEANQADALRWLDLDHGNLRVALRSCLSERDGETGLRMAIALRHFWYIRGHIAEGRRSTELMLSVRGQSGDELTANALNAIGAFAWREGSHAVAREAYEKALAIFEKLGERSRAAAALTNLALVQEKEGNLEGAIRDTTRAIEAYTRLGDERCVAEAKLNLGHLTHAHGDWERARALFLESLASFESHADTHRKGMALYNLGISDYLFRKDYKSAKLRFRQSLAIRLETGDRAGVAQRLLWLGFVAFRTGDLKSAAQLIGVAQRIAEEGGGELEISDSGEHALVIDSLVGSMTEPSFESVVGSARSMTNIDEFVQSFACTE